MCFHVCCSLCFFFNDTATTEIYTLSLHDALPILPAGERAALREALLRYCERDTWAMVKLLERLRGFMEDQLELFRSEEHTSELQSRSDLVCRLLLEKKIMNRDYSLLCDRFSRGTL